MTDLDPAASSVLATYRQHGLDPVRIDALHARLRHDLGFVGTVAPPLASLHHVVWSAGRFLRAFGLLAVVAVTPATPVLHGPQVERGHDPAPSSAAIEPSFAAVPPAVFAVRTNLPPPAAQPTQPVPKAQADTSAPLEGKTPQRSRRTTAKSATRQRTPQSRANRPVLVPPAATQDLQTRTAGFAEQLQLVKAAQKHVAAGKHAAALVPLAKLDRLAGDDTTFVAERLLLLAEARCGLGHKDVARRVAERLARQYPNHALVHKARRVCE